MSFRPTLPATKEEPPSFECEDVPMGLLAKFPEEEMLQLVAKAGMEYMPEFVAWFACRHSDVLAPTEPDPLLLRRASTPVADREPSWSHVECVCSFPKLDQVQIVGSACVYELSAQPDLLDRLERLVTDETAKMQLDQLSGFMASLIRANKKAIVQQMIELELEAELEVLEQKPETEPVPDKGTEEKEADTEGKSTEQSDYSDDSDEKDPTEPYPIACNAMLERWSDPENQVALTELMTEKVPRWCKSCWWHLKASDQEKLLTLFAEAGTDYVLDFVESFGCRHVTDIKRSEDGSWQLHRRPDSPFPYDSDGWVQEAKPPNCYCSASPLYQVLTFGRSAILELSANPHMGDTLGCNTHQDAETEDLVRHLGVCAIRHILRWLSLDIQQRMVQLERTKLKQAAEMRKQWDQGGWQPEQTTAPPVSHNWGGSSLETWLRNVKPEYGLGARWRRELAQTEGQPLCFD